MTAWPELAKLDPVAARERMAYPILVDARNALTPRRSAGPGSP
jgi:hypothetical protein